MPIKSLNSKFHDGKWRDKEVVSLPVNHIWQSVPIAIKFKNKEFYHKIKEDIVENGLNFPLLVVKSTYAELQKQKAYYKDKLLPLPLEHEFYGYVVWGGSNRLSIARELQYEFVDCVIFDSYREAQKTQRVQREPYKGKYY